MGSESDALKAQIREAEREWAERWKRGPTRLRWTAVPPQLGDPAPDLELRDTRNRAVRLRDFWKDRPALLLFWRHYGCGCGIDRARRLRVEYSDYVAAGANVVIVGQGEPERAKAYADKYAVPGAVLYDPEFRAYETYGLLEGEPSQVLYDASEALLRRDYEAGMKLADERRKAGRPMVDNPWQLPGEFVVGRDGVIRLAFRYQYCEDFPDPRVVVAAIREAGGA